MEKQPFEKYPELTESILHGATHWMTDGSGWNKLLSEINKIAEENDSLKRSFWSIKVGAYSNEEMKLIAKGMLNQYPLKP